MILVADSGSTKTTWSSPHGGTPLVTEGLNPHFSTDAQVLDACRLVERHFSIERNSTLAFYGAGCGDPTQRARMQRLLQQGLGTADVTVDTDLLGACHATCGHHEGLVGILGTGSNACFYDGHQVARQPFSTGYILGDQGSGNHLGRRLLDDYLAGRMPSGLAAAFADEHPEPPAQLMDAVYHQPYPNRFLAQIGRFAVVHQTDPYCRQLIEQSLQQWHDLVLHPIVQDTACRALYMVGGIAAAVAGTLHRLSADWGLQISAVVADPMPGLLEYHASC